MEVKEGKPATESGRNSQGGFLEEVALECALFEVQDSKQEHLALHATPPQCSQNPPPVRGCRVHHGAEQRASAHPKPHSEHGRGTRLSLTTPARFFLPWLVTLRA